jgi:CBS domain containing-hemolysin-like protein
VEILAVISQGETLEIINIILVIVLIIFTAFFVASEFAIVKVRRSRIDHLIEQGNKNAQSVSKVLNNLDGYLSACQLGITITALGLGWLGEPTVEALLEPIFESLAVSDAMAHTLSFVIAFAFITFLHVVIGELAPKTLAIQKAEAVSLYLARPLIFFNFIMYPFIWFLNGSARLFVRLFGLQPASEHEVAHSEEELRIILSESYASGEINQSELQFVNKIFEFDDRTSKEIMVPRTEIICLYEENTLEENLAIIREEKFTRYPVADGDKDSIVGVVNIKEMFNALITNQKLPIKDYIRPIISALETTPIKELLVKLQKERSHMAILVDEYGGTAGLVTVEDILEEIVGEIRDEFDIDEEPMIEHITPYEINLDGKVLISEVNDLFGLSIDDSDLDTIGGWILSEGFDVIEGSVIEYEDYDFEIIDIDGHQIKKVKVTKKQTEEEPDGGED